MIRLQNNNQNVRFNNGNEINFQKDVDKLKMFKYISFFCK